MTQIQTTIDLEVLECGVCAIQFAVPQARLRKLKETGNSFYCPNGCCISYCEPKNKVLQKEVDRLRGSETYLKDQLQATKAELDTIKQRIQNGTCPQCNRHFRDLARHMKCKHGQKVKK